MRWIRFINTLIHANFKSKLNINDSSVITFNVWLTDVDASIMNHAAMMVVMETGRIDLMVRTGFFKLARKNKWYFPTSAITVQFIRPLKLFQKAQLITKVFNVDEKWIYLEQKIMRNDKVVAICIVKSTVKKGKESLNNLDIVKQLNIGEPPAEAHDLIKCFEDENKLVKERLSN